MQLTSGRSSPAPLFSPLGQCSFHAINLVWSHRGPLLETCQASLIAGTVGCMQRSPLGPCQPSLIARTAGCMQRVGNARANPLNLCEMQHCRAHARPSSEQPRSVEALAQYAGNSMHRIGAGRTLHPVAMMSFSNMMSPFSEESVFCSRSTEDTCVSVMYSIPASQQPCLARLLLTTEKPCTSLASSSHLQAEHSP